MINSTGILGYNLLAEYLCWGGGARVKLNLWENWKSLKLLNFSIELVGGTEWVSRGIGGIMEQGGGIKGVGGVFGVTGQGYMEG